MPLEDFDLAPPAPDPLDMGGFVPMPGPVAGRQPQAPQGGTDKRALLKLAMLIPMAMKAGPGAMQGLLAGWQQAQQQKQAQGIQQGRFDAQQGQPRPVSERADRAADQGPTAGAPEAVRGCRRHDGRPERGAGAAGPVRRPG